MSIIGRFLALAGAAGLVVAAMLPWVTVAGLPLRLDLGLISASVSPGGKTVSGTDTSAWPFVIGAGVLVALLALANVMRKLALALGLLIVVAGGGLLYYVSNVVDIETSGHSALERALAGVALTSSVGPGPVVVIASGLAITLGALLR